MNDSDFSSIPRNAPKPRVWAHRGASVSFPENTLSAFQGAIDAGADGVELDVHLSSDGRLVVTHDEDTVRVTGKHGRIAAMTLAELRALNFAAFRPDAPFETAPTLDEVFELIAPSRLTINIELKNSIEAYPEMEEKILALVDERSFSERVLYSSFNHDSMAKMKRLDPRAKVGLLFQFFSWGVFRRATEIGAAALHPHWRLARFGPFVGMAHRRGIAVHGWTVNSVSGFEACRRAGADAVITNDPAAAVRSFSDGTALWKGKQASAG